MEFKEWLAKWLAMVVENGEPYEDFENYEFPPSYDMGKEIKEGSKDAFYNLIEQPLIKFAEEVLRFIEEDIDSELWGFCVSLIGKDKVNQIMNQAATPKQVKQKLEYMKSKYREE